MTSGTHEISLVGLNTPGGDRTLFIDDVHIAPAVVTPPPTPRGGSFEVPTVGAGSYVFKTLTGSPWTFDEHSGVSGNYGFGYNVAPEGVQVGFLNQTGVMKQNVTLSAGTYALNFSVATRWGALDDMLVEVDGQVVGTFTQTNAPNDWQRVTTDPFTVTAGSHEISLVGLNTPGGDRTLFVDDVHIVPDVIKGPDPMKGPDAPSFKEILSTSLKVVAPPLPALATSLTLQRKLASGSDTTYTDVADGLAGASQTAVTQLSAATAYTFRYVAVGGSGTANGTAASVTTQLPPGSGSGLRGRYYASPNFQNFALERIDSKVNFSWGTGSPGPNVGVDNFTVQWEGEIEPKFSEDFTFYTDVDNQANLWINDQLVIDHMRLSDGGDEYQSAPIALHQGGHYKIRLNYREYDGSARARLLWSSPSQVKEVIPSTQLYPAPLLSQTGNPAGGNGLSAIYYDDPEFTQPVMTRLDADVNFDWGTKGPGAGISPNSYSVLWTGQIEVPQTANYTFRANANDVARIAIDGQIVYDGFFSIGNRLPSMKVVHLERGDRHDFVIQYVNYNGSASISLDSSTTTASAGNYLTAPFVEMSRLPQEWLFPGGTNHIVPTLKEADSLFLSSACLSQNTPTTMVAGQSYDVTIVMNNTGIGNYISPGTEGSTTGAGGPILPGGAGWWQPGQDLARSPWVLISQNWANNRIWNLSRSEPAQPAVVEVTKPNATHDIVTPRWALGLTGAGVIFTQDIFGPPEPNHGYQWEYPAQQITFNLHVTAPSEPGIYPFQWKMAHLGVEPDGFGQSTPLVNVQVVAPPIVGSLEVVKTTASDVQVKLPTARSGVTTWKLERLTPALSPLPPVQGLALWLRPEALANLGTNRPLQQWPDASGQARNAVQAKPASRPLYTPQGINGRGAVHFDGTSDFLNLPPGFGNWQSGLSVFTMSRFSTKSDGSRLFELSNGPGQDEISLGRYGGTEDAVYGAGTQVVAPGALRGDQWRTFSVIHDAAGANPDAPTGVRFFDNGAQQSAAQGILPWAVGRNTNLIAKSSRNDTALFAGDIAEILLYNRALSETERSSVEAYLQTKFGTEAAPGNGVWQTVATGIEPGASYLDQGVTPDTTYWYRCVPDGAPSPLVGPVRARTLCALPEAPPAPVLLSRTAFNATFTLPPAPARAQSLQIERRFLDDAAADWVRVRDDERDENGVRVSGLEKDADYLFRWVAINESGETAGPTTQVSSSTAAPAPPEAPTFQGISATGLTVVLPPLPEGATSLSLQEMDASQNTPSFVTVATDLEGESEVRRTNLPSSTAYSYRAVAVGVGGQTPGPAAGISTPGAMAPPGAPVVTLTGPTSVNVTAPDYGYDVMRLEVKYAGEDDSSYQLLAKGLQGQSVYPVKDLFPGQSYAFRYVGYNPDTISQLWPGPSTSITMPSPVTTWSAATPITCAGIRFPTPGQNVAVGSETQLMAFVATDWDERISTAGGFVTRTRQSDPCTYAWTASGGAFKEGVASGQGVTWIAPGPGTYTLTLTVDDRNGANIGNGEGGTRDDGANDAAQTFQTTITVF